MSAGSVLAWKKGKNANSIRSFAPRNLGCGIWAEHWGGEDRTGVHPELASLAR